MVKNKEVVEPIPEHFASLEEAGEFWDTHDLGDYWELTEEVEFDVALQRERVLVAVEPALAQKVASMAHRRGVATETLINLWLSEKIHELAA